MIQRTLPPSCPADVSVLIAAPNDAPFFFGGFADGEEWLCSCGKLLASAIHPNQVLNVDIRCSDCKKLSQSPRLETGSPFASPNVVVAAGSYTFSGTVKGSPIPLVGSAAREQYVLETGQRSPGLDGPLYDLPRDPLDGNMLRAMAERLEKALSHQLPKLSAADARASRSPTPPDQRQRVIELIAFAKDTANDMDAAEPANDPVDIHGELLAELLSLNWLLDRWSQHPAMPKLLETLAHPTEPQHTLMLLGVASYLVDAGNGVGIYFGEADGKVADLWIQSTLQERIEVEIKVPLPLRTPSHPLSTETASRVVAKAIKKAHGQLLTGSSHILAIGGLGIGESLDVLEVETRKLLYGQRQRKHELMGVVIFDMSFEAQGFGNVPQFLSPVMTPRLVTHRGYKGQLKIDRRPEIDPDRSIEVKPHGRR